MAGVHFTNKDFKIATGAFTVQVHVAPGLLVWWNGRINVAVWLMRLACWVGGMGFEMGEKP